MDAGRDPKLGAGGENRALADNRAVAVTAINAGLQRLMH